ncbi:rhomboid family intramembrane serine protease [Halorubrum sp. JWXQ-INN 858]|uniref:rhomboid family intramembrane serine protease n=1 Tax=Halorubrum sp. JWXQ-INN 858 TaxID=2690782 RepID=UPI00135A13B8|nr:rhomboid family intramembrane serine protease [Halorubrum sp. JWXQ-INN 858]MWV64258.1 rhomboid family intramembrane serine protease [Halorubrum sp. JWXQ-INN 858]
MNGRDASGAGGRRADQGDRRADADRDPGDAPDGLSVRDLLRGVLAAVRSRPTAELALVAVPIPALLVAVALLPGTEAWRFSLAADGVLESRTTLWTAFASSFVHTNASHLADNVVNYWLLVAVAYPLSVIAGWRRRFLYAAVIYLAVVPLASAAATLAVLGSVTDAPAAGFSDVNNALLGYLVVVWFAALASETGPADSGGADGAEGGTDGASNRPRRRVGVDPRWSAVAVCGSLAVVFAVPSGVDYFPALPAVGALFAAVAVLAAAALLAGSGRPRVVGLDLPAPRELLYVCGASVAVAGVIGSLVVVPFGSNVYAHLVGYVVGFSVPFLAVIAGDRA